MYLHLGQSVMVPKKDVVAVLDLDNTSQSYLTREFLSAAEKACRVVNVSDDLPKSFVVCQSGDKVTVYLSQLNSATLRGRSEGPF